MKYTTNQYVEIFYKLPIEIKDVVAASSTTEHLWKIGQKHNLQIDKVGIMTDIAFDVMMGIISSKNFVAELQKELQISALDASVLARDIDENVFKPIKNTMISLYGDKAPNKPSSSLVQLTEEDDDHSHLDKDLLLREIESPVIAKPRVENKAAEVDPVAQTQSKVIEEYHEEIKTGTVLPEPLRPMTDTSLQEQYTFSTPESEKVLRSGPNPKLTPLTKVEAKIEIPPETKAPTPPASFDSLHRLADMKLSQTFVMPKMGGETTPQVAPQIPKPIIEPVRSQTNISPKVEVKKEMTEAAPKPVSDPYREPLG